MIFARCRFNSIAILLFIVAAADLSAGEMRLLNEKYVKAGGYGATSVSFSPDGRVLASDNGNAKILPPDQRQSLAWYLNWHLQLWDVESGRMIDQSKAIPSNPAKSSLRFLLDGKTVVSANGMTGGHEMRAWSVTGGIRNATYRTPKIVREFGIAGSPLTTSDQIVTSLAISPDGQSLAAAGSYGFANDTTILKVWPTNGSSHRRISHQLKGFYISAICWSPDGDAVVMQVPEYEESQSVQGKPGGGSRITGSAIVVCDADNVETEIFRQRFAGVPQGAGGLASIPGTSWIAFSGPQQSVIVFDLSDRNEQFRLKGGDGTLAVSRDGSLLAAGNNSVVIWNLKTREVFARSRIAKGVVYDLEFSPDGSKLAIAGHNLYVWDLPKVKQAGLERP